MHRTHVILGTIVLAMTAGCGQGSRSVAGDTAAPATTAANGVASPTTTTAPSQPDTPPSWGTVLRDTSSGVVRIDVGTCDGTATGSGFLIAPHLVATVARVVEGTGWVRVTAPGPAVATAARVIGLDHVHDLALLSTDARIDGHVFRLQQSTPEVGAEMMAVGFPLGRQMQTTTGTVTGTNDHRVVGDDNGRSNDLSDVVVRDAALNPGNSGGPWITRSGDVIALDESGPPYASPGERAQGNNGGVAATDAAPIFAHWSSEQRRVPNGECPTDTTTEAMQQTLDAYFFDINSSDFGSAYAQRDGDAKRALTRQDFDHGVDSSTDTAPDGSDAGYSWLGTGATSDGRYADVSFVSTQHADRGLDQERCTLWALRYTFTLTNGLWLIHSARAQPGKTAHKPWHRGTNC